MSVTLFAKTKAVLSGSLSIAMLITPAWLFGLFGIGLDAGGDLVGRLFGLLIIGVCIELWCLAKPENMSTQSATGYAVTDLLCAVICIFGVVSGTMNALGWVFVLAYLASMSGFIYSRRQLA